MNTSGRIILSLLGVVGYLLIAPSIIVGCTCDLPEAGKTVRHQVTEALHKSKAVFVGRVVGVKDTPQALYVDVKFEVERSWKGAHVHDKITIRTGRGNGDCGFHFEIGKSYLVYAYGSDEKTLETNICQRTSSIADASEDLRLLGGQKLLHKRQNHRR